jgi:hypothetical protein
MLRLLGITQFLRLELAGPADSADRSGRSVARRGRQREDSIPTNVGIS